MVFWDTYPLLNIIQSKFNREFFKSQIFDKDVLESPTGVDAIIINSKQNNHFIEDVCKFIKINFGNPPNTPVLNIPNEKLIGSKDHVVFVRDIDKNIVGCIRYHFIGIFSTSKCEEIYCVDCFTVHKRWRKKGVGEYLLNHLHNYVNQRNIPYSLFLKEGRNLSIALPPLYTSTYVYREIEREELVCVKDLTPHQAYRLMDLFRELNPGMFIIRNIYNQNQFWRLYKKDTFKVLACFQDTYQSFEKDNKNKKLCWCTAWIESPNMTDNVREEASRELSASMYPDFDFVWMNKVWIGNSSLWKEDGPFYWYSYQWITSINIKKSYCILN
jgi:GNAT superfamily N-acetyltransferase